MADVNANIGVNIDTTQALAQLKALQRQISQFHTSIAKSSESAALAQRDLQRNFINAVNSIGAFSAELRTVRTTAESFTDSLEKNKFSMREYFRYAGGATKTFGKLFKSEFDTIGKVAEDRVKRLQTQYIKLGRDSSGAMKAIAVIPNELDLNNFSTQTQLAAQRQAIFNQLVKQGSTNLLNFGKNTQWAGRQLMVGFTLPLATLGTTAAKTFMEMEAAALKFRKVYGDLFTPKAETQQALADVTALGQMFTKYGISVASTVGLAAEAAAAGFQGIDLQRQTTQATRLSVLGQIENQKALETTISLQNAFKMSSEDLAGSIDFLNAVENQTVVSLDDITTAIPKVAPVIQQLGGDVKDLAFFMAAMKEGGVNASEGANALKSGLASLINPTEKASAMLASMGINIKKIVEANKGDLKGTVIAFAQALDTLDPLTRARAIEQLFGKFQFARLSTLFDNVTNQTGQAARVLDLAGTSIEDLAALSESELGMTADSAMNKFRKSVEDLKMALIPVGKTFLEAVTPIVEFIGGILDKFNNLSDGVKKAIVVMTVAIGAIGPIALMTFGLLANGLANIIKGAMILRNGYLRLTGQTQVLGEQTDYLTTEQMNASAVAHSLDQSHAKLTQTFTAETNAINQLIQAYEAAARAGAQFAMTNPGMMRTPRKYNKGVVVVPGSGNKDTVPAMLTPGEAVIPAEMTKKYGALINGMIAGDIPGYRKGMGTGTAVDIPGGFAAAHYGGSSYRSGQELLDMVEGLDTAFARQIRAMVAEVEDGLNRVFTVFSNEVVATSTELNRAVGKTGSGKTADINIARRDLIERGDVRDIELQRQLKDAGVSIEEFQEINRRITEEIEIGFDDLGNITTVTAEDLDKLIKDAYNKVAETDQRVREALDKMHEITAVTDPRTDARVAVAEDPYFKSRKSGKYYKGMEEMAGPSNVPYTEKARFKITNKMAEEIGLTSAEAAAVYNQFSDEVKIKLAGLKEDIVGFTKEFEKEAEIAGLKTGESYKVGIDKSGLEDIYVESRKRRSPHELASKDGNDDGIAYEKAREKAVTRTRRVATRAGGTVEEGGVITPTNPPKRKGRRGASRPGGTVGPGGTILPGGAQTLSNIQSSTAISNKTKETINEEIKARKTNQQRLDSVNKALMSGSFALTSLAGAGSMAGGTIGELSQAVFKYSGLLFGLMSITQLLTQAKITELVATRASTAAKAMGGTNVASLFTRGGGLAGFGKNILTAGKFLVRFAGPVGLATSTVLASVAAFKFYNKKQEEARQAIEGLGDAALLAEGKIKTLGDFFGVAPQKTRLERSGPALVVNQQTRSQIDALRESEGFQKEFAKDIEALKGASASQAELVFKSLAMQLKGKGFAAEQVKTIILALQEESGKTDLKLDFAKFDLSTAAGQEELKKTANTLGKSFGKQFATGYSTETRSGINRATGEVVTWTNETISKGLQKSVSTTSKVIAGMFNGLSGQIENGTITAEQFNQSFETISSTISNMPKPQAMFLLQNILKNMPGDLAKSAAGIKNVSDQLLIAKAAALGVSTITPAMIKALQTAAKSTDGGAARAADRVRKQIKSDIKAVQELFDLVKKETDKAAGGGTTGDEEKTPFELAIKALEKERDELTNTTKAFNILRKAGVDAETALKYASDQVVALGLATGKLKPEQIKQVVDLIGQIGPKVETAAVREFFTKLNAETQLKKDLSTIVPQLSSMGAKLEDITSLLQNPDLVSYLTDPLLTAEERAGRIKRYLDGIAAQKEIDIKIKLQTPEGIDQEFADRKAMAMEYFDVLERGIQDKFEEPIKAAEKSVESAASKVKDIQDEIDGLQTTVAEKQRNIELIITRPIEALQQSINDLQRNMELKFDRPIGALQNESSLLSEDLTVMDKAAEAINKKYDLQAAALEEVSQINQEIINQQKQQIGLAGALSTGDIAAAAQAAQEMRSSAAATASQGTGKALQAARESEIAGLRSASGMTRDQIAQRQYEIDRQIFALQEQRKAVESEILVKQDAIYKLEQSRVPLLAEIQVIEDQIYGIQTGRLATAQANLDKANAALETQRKALQAELDQIDAQREKWEDAQLALDTAKAQSDEFQKKLKDNENTVKAMVDKWNLMQDKKLTVTITEIRNVIVNTIQGSGSSGTSGTSGSGTSGTSGGGKSTTQFKYFGGKIKRMASGGFVPGIGLTDKVPALLSPGEFVVNKNSARAFSPFLRSLNDAIYPSMIKDKMNQPVYAVSNPVNISSMPTATVVAPVSDNSSTVYNYNVGITVGGTNSNPNGIARAVIDEIKYIDSQRIRSQRA